MAYFSVFYFVYSVVFVEFFYPDRVLVSWFRFSEVLLVAQSLLSYELMYYSCWYMYVLCYTVRFSRFRIFWFINSLVSGVLLEVLWLLVISVLARQWLSSFLPWMTAPIHSFFTLWITLVWTRFFLNNQWPLLLIVLSHENCLSWESR